MGKVDLAALDLGQCGEIVELSGEALDRECSDPTFTPKTEISGAAAIVR